MDRMTTLPPAHTDYRHSHLHKGEEYENWLNQGGFEPYMHAREAAGLESTIRAIRRSTAVERALDFACGTGRITSILERLVKDVVGIDVSESMVAQARKKCTRTQFIIQDITSSPLDIPAQHLITAFRFFGNAEPPLRRAALAALVGLLSPGGYLVINNHRNPSSLYSRIKRLRGDHVDESLGYSSLYGLLKEAGLTVTSTYGIGGWFLHDRLDREAVVNSRFVRVVEPLSRTPGVYRVCPDAIIVARKHADR
jgi:SAM-dependent methyltransferase